MTSAGNRRHQQIGIDRLVRLEWLERTALLAVAGNERSTIKKRLREILEGAFPSSDADVRGSLDKTMTILVKIWVCPPTYLNPLLHYAWELFSRMPRERHIVLHWGMTMAVYPFWGAVAAYGGRLLRLQGTAAASQVQRRVREQYGERETVSRRVRYVLRSFIDWGVLKETAQKGVYVQGLSCDVDQVDLIAWLTDAFLHAHPGGAAPLKAIIESPSLFPFRIRSISAAQLTATSDRLDIVRHGLDQDLIMLRRSFNSF